MSVHSDVQRADIVIALFNDGDAVELRVIKSRQSPRGLVSVEQAATLLKKRIRELKRGES